MDKRTYELTMKVTGYCHVTVQAESYEEAEKKANLIIEETDFGALEEIDWGVQGGGYF